MDASKPTVDAETIAQLEAERRRLSDALTLAEQDRQQLSYDVHDGVVQDLTAAAMLLESAGRQFSGAPAEAQANYAGGLRLLRDSIAEARRLIRGVTTVQVFDGALIPSLNRLVTRVRGDLQLPVVFTCGCQTMDLPESIQRLLLRIAQESLYNVWKHARATEVEVRLTANQGELELVIADNGVGFDPAQVSGGHFGLEGIRARVRALGAKLLFDTAPNHGTRVVVRLKLPPAV